MNIIRVAGAVVDQQKVRLYKEDGTHVDIPQGDQRVRAIVDEIIPIIQAQQVAEIDLDSIGGQTDNSNPYREFEELTQNFVRFFRIGKKVLEGLIEAAQRAELDDDGKPVEPLKPMAVGTIPTEDADDEDADEDHEEVPEARKTPISAAVDEIIAHAEPVSGEGFSDSATTEDHTIVAVVDNAGKQTPIPGVEQLRDQFVNSVRSSPEGMQNFLKRLGAVIDQRQHSVEDVLKFLKAGDLPIADDGSILVYKVLKRKGNGYVDCHTGNVPQRIGSFVCVDPSLVDLNRRNECSNGLHVARRGYIGGFNGDLCTLAKVAPEDVMVVPHGDANKVRVTGYHLLFELDNDSWQKLRSNKPMTSNPGAAKLLTRAMKGDHPARTEEVRIHGQHGSNVKVTSLVNGSAKNKPAQKVEPTKALDDKPEIEPIDPTQVADKVADTANVSRKDKAEALFKRAIEQKDASAAAELLEFKRKAKVSWESLGIDQAVVGQLSVLAAASTPAQEPKEEEVLELTEVHTPTEEAKAAVSNVAHQIIDEKTPEKKAAPVRPTGHRAQRIQVLCDIIRDSKDDRHRVKAARELLDIRRETRKSWSKLGQPQLNDDDLRTIVNANIDVAPPKAVADAPARSTTKKKAAVAAPQSYTGSRVERARAMFDAKDWMALAALKKSSKVSWTALGLSNGEVVEAKLHMGD